MISLSHHTLSNQVPGLPPQLVKDYAIEFYNGDQLVFIEEIKNNYMRFRVHKITQNVSCDRIRIHVSSTYGDNHARVFEVRVY